MGRTWTNNRGYCVHCKKFIHKNNEAAFAHRKQLIDTGKHCTKSGTLSVYRCPHGFGWHVGHSQHK